jgi:mannose-6-phosphate isomerase-like protein (cupin superfamily)
MGCFELRVPPGSNVPPPHSHSTNEELVYVLEGTLRYTVGSETRDLQPGDSMATARGVVHAFSNPHAVVARALVINTPDIGPGYFREVATIVNADGAPDRAALLATMRRYGLAPPTISRGGSPC